MKHRFPCPSCQQEVSSVAAPGRKTTCGKCGEKVRVPLRKADTGQTVTWAECGAQRETSAAPGRTTPYKQCGAKIRVPLRDPDDAIPVLQDIGDAPPPPVVRQTCPGCLQRVHAPLGVCPVCEASIDSLRAVQDGLPVGLAVHAWAVRGVILCFLVACAAWLVYGLTEGVVYVWPLGLLCGMILVGILSRISR